MKKHPTMRNIGIWSFVLGVTLENCPHPPQNGQTALDPKWPIWVPHFLATLANLGAKLLPGWKANLGGGQRIFSGKKAHLTQ